MKKKLKVVNKLNTQSANSTVAKIKNAGRTRLTAAEKIKIKQLGPKLGKGASPEAIAEVQNFLDQAPKSIRARLERIIRQEVKVNEFLKTNKLVGEDLRSSRSFFKEGRNNIYTKAGLERSERMLENFKNLKRQSSIKVSYETEYLRVNGKTILRNSAIYEESNVVSKFNPITGKVEKITKKNTPGLKKNLSENFLKDIESKPTTFFKKKYGEDVSKLVKQFRAGKGVALEEAYTLVRQKDALKRLKRYETFKDVVVVAEELGGDVPFARFLRQTKPDADFYNENRELILEYNKARNEHIGVETKTINGKRYRRGKSMKDATIDERRAFESDERTLIFENKWAEHKNSRA